MKKLLYMIGVAAAGYLAAAFAAWHFIPEKIADSERRLVGVRVAIARISQDQNALSQSIKAVTDSTLGKGRSKVDEVEAMLGDDDVNRLSEMYLGGDFALQRSSFMGEVSHLRESMNIRFDSGKTPDNANKKRIDELKARKRRLTHQMRSPAKEGARRAELDDIEALLADLQQAGMENPDRGDSESKGKAAARAEWEAKVYQIAAGYQKNTIGKLDAVMKAKLAELRMEENRPARLRAVMSPFDIWPLNSVFERKSEDRQ